MKNAAVAGLIAGFFGGIGATLSFVIAVLIGLYDWPVSILTVPFLTSHATFEILIHLIYGPIFGLIYSKVYDMIPGKGIWKGLIYSFLIYLISNIRPAILIAAHSTPETMGIVWTIGLTFAGFFVFLIYGLVLGYLYKKE